MPTFTDFFQTNLETSNLFMDLKSTVLIQQNQVIINSSVSQKSSIFRFPDDTLIQLIDPRHKGIFDQIINGLAAFNIYEDVAIRLMGGMAPIFGVSPNCADASWTYLGNFFLSLPQPGEEGKFPEEWVIRSKL